MGTESGKLEIYCGKLSEAIDCFGSYHIDPIAKYCPPQEGYEASFDDFEAGVPGAHPLVLHTPHTSPHNAAQLGNSHWLREAWPCPIYMNPVDAEARGLSSGDTVRVFNDRGAFVRQVKVTSRLMPSQVMASPGLWTEYDEELGVDLGGSPNVLTSTEPNGADVNPWNTVNVEVEKWDGPFVPDHLRALKTDGLEED